MYRFWKSLFLSSKKCKGFQILPSNIKVFGKGDYMVGIYFSGTGNTKYCVEEYVNFSVSKGRFFSIEDPDVKKAFASEENEVIVLGFPSHNGDLPLIVKDFLEKNKNSFSGREVMIIVTMAKVSGDCAGRCAKLLKSYGAQIQGTVHIKMPDIRADVEKRFTSIYQNQTIVNEAKSRIHTIIIDMKRGKSPSDGTSTLDKIAGKLNKGITKESVSKITIDPKKCNKCQECIAICPTKTLSFQQLKIVANDNCTYCYRCVNTCKKKAITILGKEVDEQSTIQMYLKEENKD